MEFKRDGNWIFATGADGKVIAEVTFPAVRDGLVNLNHTFVDGSLRGQGVAGQLCEAAYEAIKGDGCKALLTCPYAVKWFGERPERSDIVAEE
jgi:predicted GNAT family acetyltransferase